MSSTQSKNDDLKKFRKLSLLGGGEERIAKQHEKGKLTARERLEELLDPSSFQELEPFILQRDDLADDPQNRILGDGVVDRKSVV